METNWKKIPLKPNDYFHVSIPNIVFRISEGSLKLTENNVILASTSNNPEKSLLLCFRWADFTLQDVLKARLEAAQSLYAEACRRADYI